MKIGSDEDSRVKIIRQSQFEDYLNVYKAHGLKLTFSYLLTIVDATPVETL